MARNWNPIDPSGKNWRADQSRVQAVFGDDLILSSKVVHGVNFVAIASLTAVPDEIIDARYPIGKRDRSRASKTPREAIEFFVQGAN